MKIYTKTGDDGSTGLFGGARVPKTDPGVEAYGSISELNAVLGLVRATHADGDVDSTLQRIQEALFCIGSELATPADKRDKLGLDLVGTSQVQWLEEKIDEAQELVPELRSFVLPGGTQDAAQMHVAVTICRRAERRTLALRNASPVRDEIIQYLNRLSDTLFVLARLVNCRAGSPETAWMGRQVP